MAFPPHLTPADSHNETLEANVHPRDWVNPRSAGRYNLVVIGAGTAGLVCAAGAAGLGARVALIERHLMGGDCLNVGCVPSKALIRASRACHDARHGGEFGVVGGEQSSVDFPRIMARMRRLRADLSRHDSARRFQDELGVDVFIGEGRFVGPQAIEVDGRQLLFARAAVCTGARAAAPPIPGLAEAGYLTNETVFSLTALPPRLAVIGGGPIGCELAQAFARFGSRVSLIQHGPQLLGREDADAAAIIETVFGREGVDLLLGAKVLEVVTEEEDRIVRVERGEGIVELRVDAILVGVGRSPNLEGLKLERGGIIYDRSGVRVDDRLRTSNPRVYAAGDICSPFKFTHTADAQARILIANALFPGRQKASALVVPWCTYTDPEIAHVGLSEREAERKGIKITTMTVPLASVDRAVIDGETEGFARVHLRRGSDQILGATVVARHAGEMLGELTLAITGGLGLAAIGRTIHPYPTQAEAIRKLADAWNRNRLTPWLQRLLGGWLQWRRR
ncbi:MAG: mercuric reductase [Desulfoprunum sp.]|uniref:mercuric reductase n=1 Tax=Desulfoprunum sp. TaxID=2020866 RepID=UPI00052BA02E|nr:mercuric reductase [Desulfobulbus sp. Tol-SR]